VNTEPIYRDAAHWRVRAAESRALAETIADAVSKRLMLEIAQDYEKLAQRAAIRAKSSPEPK
jgi:hypothetical protein